MLCSCIIILLLSEKFSELHKGATLTLSVFKFTGKFQVSLHKHLKLILVHLCIDLVTTDLTKITNGNRLTSNTRHLDGISQGELVIDR